MVSLTLKAATTRSAVASGGGGSLNGPHSCNFPTNIFITPLLLGVFGVFLYADCYALVVANYFMEVMSQTVSY